MISRRRRVSARRTARRGMARRLRDRAAGRGLRAVTFGAVRRAGAFGRALVVGPVERVRAVVVDRAAPVRGVPARALPVRVALPVRELPVRATEPAVRLRLVVEDVVEALGGPVRRPGGRVAGRRGSRVRAAVGRRVAAGLRSFGPPELAPGPGRTVAVTDVPTWPENSWTSPWSSRSAGWWAAGCSGRPRRRRQPAAGTRCRRRRSCRAARPR